MDLSDTKPNQQETDWRDLDLTPRQIVEALDKYIIGQKDAKKAVAVALRNRSRRRQLSDDLREEVAPKNIIMIGPTGVGKTEIARRLSKLAQAPFIKVEATKYTEVGYVGRDVESMVRDLVSLAINMIKKNKREAVRVKAEERMENHLLDILLPSTAQVQKSGKDNNILEQADDEHRLYRAKQNREKMLQKLRNNSIDEQIVEIEIKSNAEFPAMQIFSNAGMDELDNTLQNVFSDIMPKSSKNVKVPIKEAKKILTEAEMDKLLDMDQISTEAVKLTEEMGIIFIDEIDKVAGRGGGSGPEISREGVQRDILPIVEGSTINTKYGQVRTDHILFIASGAFHVAKPSDLIPELQGRFPTRVELKSLTREDFQAILNNTENSLIKQYCAMMKTEGVQLSFTDDGIQEISRIAFTINNENENIGARRLHTIMEKLLEDISFEAPDLSDDQKEITIDAEYVKEKLKEILKNQDLTKYIL